MRAPVNPEPANREPRPLHAISFMKTTCSTSLCSAGASPTPAWTSTTVVHFQTGEPIAKVSRANGGMIQRDMRRPQRAREALREIPIDELIARVGKAGELYATAELPMGDGTQTPDAFVHAQSATHRSARAAVPREHEEEHVRAHRNAPHPDVADARAWISTC